MEGMVLPQSIEAEEAVIGACLIDRHAFDRVSLDSEAFYRPQNQMIWQAMIDLREDGRIIDTINTEKKLKTKGQLEEIGGLMTLVDLCNKVASGNHILDHALLVKDSYIARQLIFISTDITKTAFLESISGSELVNKMAFALVPLQAQGNKGRIVSKMDVIKEIELGQQRSNKSGMTGIRVSPIYDYDAMIDGGEPGDIIIIAARPGMGKTAFAVSCLNLDIDKGISSDLFSLEMSASKLTRRLLGCRAKIHSDKTRTGDFTPEEQIRWDKAKEDYLKSNVRIVEAAGFTAMDVMTTLVEHKSKYGTQKAYIDYGQLLNPIKSNQNKEVEVAETSKFLKTTAKKIEIPMVVFLQMNREVEKRGNKRGKLSDLRESGAWEQDADVVTFIYRPGYYDKDFNEHEDAEGNMVPEKHYTELLIEKNREGELGYLRMKFCITHFESYLPQEKWNTDRNGDTFEARVNNIKEKK